MTGSLRERLRALDRSVNDVLPGPTKVGFLTLYVYSTHPLERLDVIASRRFWDRWTDLGIGVLLSLQVGGMVLVAVAARRALGQPHSTALNEPANAIAIPGLNAFMPLAAAPYVVVALVIATVVHEGGHAIACRGEDVRIVEWGVALLLGVVPLAAYVLPAEELDRKSARSQMRIYTVGVFHNLLVAGVASGLLLLPVTASPVEVYMGYFGWALVGGSPPTAAGVASFGVLSNLCFWTALLNANFGLLNALPVTFFDGGRVLSLALRRSSEVAGRPLSPRVRSMVVHGTSIVAILLVVLAVLGPSLSF